MRYEITVEGTLDAAWTDIFNGMTITLIPQDKGKPLTTLKGEVHDQAALRGILNKLWDLNLRLISVVVLDT